MQIIHTSLTISGSTTSDMAIYYRLQEEIESHCVKVCRIYLPFLMAVKQGQSIGVANYFFIIADSSNQVYGKGCMRTSAVPFDTLSRL